MTILHENILRNLWEVFRKIHACVLRMEQCSEVPEDARRMMRELLEDMLEWATDSEVSDVLRLDLITCPLDELREACAAVRNCSLHYIRFLADDHILESGEGGRETCPYFRLSRALFQAGWHLGRLYPLLGLEEERALGKQGVFPAGSRCLDRVGH